MQLWPTVDEPRVHEGLAATYISYMARWCSPNRQSLVYNQVACSLLAMTLLAFRRVLSPEQMAHFSDMLAYGHISPPGMANPAWTAAMCQTAAAGAAAQALPISAAMQAAIPARRHTDDGTGGAQA